MLLQRLREKGRLERKAVLLGQHQHRRLGGTATRHDSHYCMKLMPIVSQLLLFSAFVVCRDNPKY